VISSQRDLRMPLLDALSHFAGVKELVLVIGYQPQLCKWECVRFIEPKSEPWFPLQAWQDVEAEMMEGNRSCVVRVMEAEIL
jgi:hypothetical protein